MTTNHEYINHEHINQDRFADSAGRPWEGRSFEPNPHADDDGSADPVLLKALAEFRSAPEAADPSAVIAAIRGARLLIPMLASLGETGEGAHGQTVDKSADLAIFTVEGPDSKPAMPAFTSMAAMAAWNPDARPIPIGARKICLAAAAEQTTRVVIDPGSETNFVLRRPLIAAIAQDLDWVSPENDPRIGEIISKSVEGEASVVQVGLAAADPGFVLANDELLVQIVLVPGLEREALQATIQRITDRWEQHDYFVNAVDSIAFQILAAQ
ncbi:MAG: hypothetical protein RLZ28_162 [Actinomycetota bacterium]|jgi:hypothetical protein